MKIKHLCSVAALFTLLLSSCSKSSSPAVTVTTDDATDIQQYSATLNGTVSNDPTNGVTRGFCYGTNNNPVRGQDLGGDVSGSGNGAFSFTIGINPVAAPNTVYHYRAYAVTSSGTTVYGSDKTFTTVGAAAVTTGAPYNILASLVHLKGTYSIAGFQSSYVGFAYSTSHNPTAGNPNSSVQYATSVTGSGSYDVLLDYLQPNTTYYVRAYTSYNGDYIYGAEQSFKTAGYVGTGGGYVVYDKGDTTGGWRYLEAAPEDVSLANNTGGYAWGCSGTAIGQTSIDAGTGPANTAHIVAGCSASGAARACNNYVSPTGVSDWFLGSREEMRYVYPSLTSLNALVANASYWTSSELTQSTAAAVSGGNSSQAYYSSESKTSFLYVRPIRRF